MPRLVVEKGNDRGKTFIVQPKTTLIVGRDNSATAQLRDTQCSRQHYRVEDRDGAWWIVDLGSMNGTLVNGKKVDKEQMLAFGDLIKIGDTLFSFLSDESAGEETMVGQRLGGYKIIERVGRGGMGTVYKAEQIDLQRIVALKVIAPEHVKNKDFIELFVHEARAAAKLNHANIVQVYDVKRQEERYYFSMEYVPGGSVQDRLNKERKIPLDESVRMILDSARGLEYAHKKEIIHRDVKPDNFMISETGSIKIGDLGLAQRLGEKLSADDEDSVIGTPHYIAPEQVLGRAADYRSDIYALGATMYRMIAGFTPYQAPSVRELVNKKVREDAIPLHEAVAGLPKRVGEICAKMMARKPEDRYQTMTEVIIELERYIKETSGEVPREPTGTVEILVANKKLLVAAVGLLVLVVVGGVIGAVAYMSKPPETPPPPPPVETDKSRDADAALGLAKGFDFNRMDPNKPEDLEKAIGEYGNVVEKFPDTPQAKEAAQRIEELKVKLREKSASIAFLEIEKQDLDNWRKMYRTFQSGTYDLSPIDDTIVAYQRFAQNDSTKGTQAGKDAERRAGFIIDWKARVAELHAAFEKVRATAATKRDEERFNEAWLMVDEFAQKALARKLNCDFASDRYSSVLLEESAREMQRKIVQSAEVAFFKIEERVGELERTRQYAGAIDLLKPVIQNYTDEIALKARAKENKLRIDWAAYRAAQLEEARKREEEAAAADAEEYDKVARDLRKEFLAGDYKAGHKLTQSASRFRTEKYKERLRTRASEFAILIEFKDNLKKVVADTKGYPGFKRTSVFPGAPGTITELRDREIVIKAGEDGGSVQLALKDIKPSLFHKWVKGAWKWNDPKVLMGLAIFCCEAGLYEQALEEIAALAAFAKEKTVQDFIEKYKPMIEAGEYTDTDEIEAEKHYNRLKQCLEPSVKALEPARREIDLLKTRYGRTKFFAERKTEIERDLEDVLRQGGEELKRKIKAEQHRSIQEKRQSSRSEAKESEPKVVGQLNRITDQFWRDARLAEFFAAHGEPARAMDKLTSAKASGDRLLTDKNLQRDCGMMVAHVYAQIFRTWVIAGNRKAAGEVRAEAQQRFTGEGKDWAWWWPEIAKRLDAWETKHKEARDIGALEKALRDAPDDPKRLWDLVDAYYTTRNYLELRGVLKALIDLFPDAPYVKSGDAPLLLADTLMAFQDLRAAHDLYRDAEKRFAEHARVKDPKAYDSVGRRKDLCWDLMIRMGLESGEDEKDKK